MLCHKMFLTIKHKNTRNSRRRRRQFINMLVLSLMWTMLFTETMARPNIEALLSNKPTNDVVEQQQQQQQQDLFLDDMMSSTNNEKLFNKMQKYHHNQPNYLNKWPGLRDLVSTLDYNDNNGLEESNDFFNTNFFERLRQLASLKSDYDDDTHYDSGDTYLMPAKSLKSSASLSSNQLSFKDHNIKKNVQFQKQYMSPCHFKICNMGRKRNARSFRSY